LDLYLVLIFFAYCLLVVIEYGVNAINLAYLTKQGATIPPEFAGEIDQTLLSKTRDYVVEKNRFGMISSVISHILLLVFLFGGVLNFYTNWIAAWRLPFVLSGILFFILLIYAQTLINLPFSWYLHFKIEAKYGFNTMTKKLWIMDTLKSLIISTILFSIIIAAGLLLVDKFTNTWWIWVWSFFLIFTLFIMYISPYVLEPLFNKFTPLEKEELTDQIRRLMEKVGIRVSRVFKMDASKRSKHTNAYFTGIGKVKRIVLYDTLLEKMTDAEIIAVLAHEIGHWKKKHILKRLLVSEILGLVVIYLAFRMLQSDFLLNLFQISTDSFFAKLVICGFLFSLAAFPLGPLFNFFSRRHEREADQFACALTGQAGPLIQALIKLSKDNLSNLHPHPLYVAFHYSHPPVVKRIRQLRILAAEVQRKT